MEILLEVSKTCMLKEIAVARQLADSEKQKNNVAHCNAGCMEESHAVQSLHFLGPGLAKNVCLLSVWQVFPGGIKKIGRWIKSSIMTSLLHTDVVCVCFIFWDFRVVLVLSPPLQ